MPTGTTMMVRFSVEMFYDLICSELLSWQMPAKLVQFRAEQSPVAARLTQGWQHAGRSGFAIVAFPSSRQKAGLITWSTYGCCGEDVLRNRTPNFRPLSLAPYFGHHLRLVTHSLLVEVVQLRLRDGGKPVVESGRHMSSRYDTN